MMHHYTLLSGHTPYRWNPATGRWEYWRCASEAWWPSSLYGPGSLYGERPDDVTIISWDDTWCEPAIE